MYPSCCTPSKCLCWSAHRGSRTLSVNTSESMLVACATCVHALLCASKIPPNVAMGFSAALHLGVCTVPQSHTHYPRSVRLWDNTRATCATRVCRLAHLSAAVLNVGIELHCMLVFAHVHQLRSADVFSGPHDQRRSLHGDHNAQPHRLSVLLLCRGEGECQFRAMSPHAKHHVTHWNHTS